MAEKKQSETVNVKVSRATYELIRKSAENLGIDAAQYLESLVLMANRKE